ncbi:ATP-binding protein [Oxalobacteraceae bacterium A2-2]
MIQAGHLRYPAFIALYLLFDWATYVDPLYGLNITPWNPDPALGLVCWLHWGWRAAPPLFLALLGGEVLVRGMPAGLGMTVLGCLWLTAGYGAIGAALRRSFGDGAVFDRRGSLVRWLAIVLAGSALNDLVYISLLRAGGLIPAGQFGVALLRFGIGDMVGVVVSMPLIWMLSSAAGRQRLRAAVWRAETLGYLGLAVCVLYSVFGSIASAEFKHFYFLFLPVIWAAARHGLCGAALMVFLLQAAIVALFKWSHAPHINVHELQLLDAVLALVGFFIGIVVDEFRQVAAELQQSLRLAAAGEMAAALAHELNQPLTALGAYGKACELLLARGDQGPMLGEAIVRMVQEAGRAAEVVRRLRDFFRTGAMRLEAVEAAPLVQGVAQQFRAQCHEHGVQLQVGHIPPLAVLADRLQIELVLRNLLANACEAVQERDGGARTVAVSADVLAAAGGPAQLRLTVTDSGRGVSPAQAARLFQPFVSSKASGLGLGLVLSRAIAEAHGGALWAEVAPQGVFRLLLPLAAGQSSSTDATQGAQRAA